jgi:hypothetical protein
MRLVAVIVVGWSNGLLKAVIVHAVQAAPIGVSTLQGLLHIYHAALARQQRGLEYHRAPSPCSPERCQRLNGIGSASMKGHCKHTDTTHDTDVRNDVEQSQFIGKVKRCHHVLVACSIGNDARKARGHVQPGGGALGRGNG